MPVLALDMGGAHVGGGVVEGDRLLAHASIETERSHRLVDLLPALEDLLRGLLSEAHTPVERCTGIAIGFPGIVDSRTGTIHSTLRKYEDAPVLDLGAWARDAFGLDLRIENDARMALLGEWHAGAARDVNDVVMMTLGTGIGTAAILHGRLLRGAHAHAGCLGGHLTTKFDGSPCHCGNLGCAEAEAGGWSMPLIARAWPEFEQSALAKYEPLGFRELFLCAEAGDGVARKVRERCLRVWAANAVSLIHAYDPEVLILGGGVMQNAEAVLPFVQEYVNAHTWSTWGKTQVQAAALGPNAALLGATRLLTEDCHGA